MSNDVREQWVKAADRLLSYIEAHGWGTIPEPWDSITPLYELMYGRCPTCQNLDRRGDRSKRDHVRIPDFVCSDKWHAESAIAQSLPAQTVNQEMLAALKHTRSCPALTPGEEQSCTCGLRYRIELQTEQTMHRAWRKRAEEAESAIARAESEPSVSTPPEKLAEAARRIADSSYVSLTSSQYQGFCEQIERILTEILGGSK